MRKQGLTEKTCSRNGNAITYFSVIFAVSGNQSDSRISPQQLPRGGDETLPLHHSNLCSILTRTADPHLMHSKEGGKREGRVTGSKERDIYLTCH